MLVGALKRHDIQGIRGLAIISVLGFHFYPHIFPNGYLGVDQFFVLSGYLMVMLLSKTENLPVHSMLAQFYSRRFKRILPLYLLVVLLILIALYTAFPKTAFLQNQSSATNALFFISNRPHTGEEDYFQKLSVAIDLFTHTWSLSVEIQFYFLVPVIFIIGNCFHGSINYFYYTFLGTISLIYYLISPYDVSFNSVFARIWQFLVGMMIYILSDGTTTSSSCKNVGSSENGESEKAVLLGQHEEFSEEDKQPESSQFYPSTSLGPFSKYCFLIPMVFIVTYPVELFSVPTRTLFTSFTGILMMLSIEDPFLSYQWLTYIGDISYSLYLVHWPILAYAKLVYSDNQFALVAALFASFLLAVLIYETYEKWYLKLSYRSIWILVSVLFLINIALIKKDYIEDRKLLTEMSNSTGTMNRLDGVTANMTFDDATSKNEFWNKYDMETISDPGCVFNSKLLEERCDIEGKGREFKIALFGNSYVKNHRKMLIQECGRRVYNFTTRWFPVCEPLAANPAKLKWDCVQHLKDFVDFIKDAKPDYAFILTRFFSVADPFSPPYNFDLEQDRTFLEMRSQLKIFLAHIKKKLFILDTFPKIIPDYVEHIASDLKNGKNIEEVSRNALNVSCYENGRIRHAKLVKECGSKCELIDYLSLLWNNSTNMIQLFDKKGFSYFTSPLHLSAHGLELVRPLYTKICDGLT